MTYERVYIPKKEEKKNDTYRDKNSHFPEIVGTFLENDEKKESRNGKRKYKHYLAKFIFVLTLCALSFIMGAFCTRGKMYDVLKNISTATSGGFVGADNDSTDFSGNNISYYQKYKDNSEKAENIADYSAGLTYLSDGYILMSEKTEELVQSDDREVSQVSATASKKGLDGEVLYPVLSKDLSTKYVTDISNETKYSPDLDNLLEKTPTSLAGLKETKNEPQILIVHTHGTECYNDFGEEGYYSSFTSVRNENVSENVVSVGKKLKEILEGFGINVVHSEKMCDKESFVKAYYTSADEVKYYLNKYPSIKLVIDLHRDSIQDEYLSKTKPVFEMSGKKYAQLMFVVGTNGAGANHPNWKENLCLALNLQSEISEKYPALFRRINLRNASFNEQLSEGYLLLECGSCANNKDEAISAITLFGTELARIMSEYINEV